MITKTQRKLIFISDVFQMQCFYKFITVMIAHWEKHYQHLFFSRTVLILYGSFCNWSFHQSCSILVNKRMFYLVHFTRKDFFWYEMSQNVTKHCKQKLKSSFGKLQCVKITIWFCSLKHKKIKVERVTIMTCLIEICKKAEVQNF